VFPLVVVAQGDGLPAVFMISDSRMIVVKRRLRTRIISIPIAEMQGLGTSHAVHDFAAGPTPLVDVRFSWCDEELRILFKKAWLSEGDALANTTLQLILERIHKK